MEIASVFGENLRKTRKQRGLRQVDLATVLDVSLPTVVRWESGENLPVGDQIDRIAQFLGVAATTLFVGPQVSSGKSVKPTLKEAIEVVTQNWDEVRLKVKAKPKK